MSDVSSKIIPKPPQNVSIPTMNAGVVLNEPSTMLPQGAVLGAANWNITTMGPKRRPGSIKFAGGATVSYAPIRDTCQLFLTNATQRIGILDTRFLYLKSGASFFRQNAFTSAGTIKTSGAHVIGDASTAFTAALLLANDIISIKPGTASAQELYISSVISKSHLLLTVPPSLTYGSGSAYKAWKTFYYVKSQFVDSVPCDAKLLFADGWRPIQYWNGASMGLWGTLTSAQFFIPRCLAYWQDRVFAGYTTEASTIHRQRIRWSRATDHTNFLDTSSADSLWQDRPYSSGALLRLIPMGKLLIGYYEDRIDIGRPTNYSGDTLPVAFEALDTGGAGLVGMKAIAQFFDGHFLVMDDGIKFFSAASGVPQNIGNPIWKDATDGLLSLQGVRVSVDFQNDSVLFAFPDNNWKISIVWVYNYKSKGWSWYEMPCTSLSNIMESTGLTIDQASGTIDSQTLAFDDYATAFRKQLAFGQSGGINLSSPQAITNADGSSISAVIETGDFCWQAPNDIKSVFSLSLKTERRLEAETTFIVEGSTNRGLTWKALGNLVIHKDEDENAVGFKLTGSTLRFRLTCSANILPFTVMECVLRVRGRGRELRFSTAD